MAEDMEVDMCLDVDVSAMVHEEEDDDEEMGDSAQESGKGGLEMRGGRMMDLTCQQAEHWVKSVLLLCLVQEGDVCCELFAGKGGDVGKWMAAKPRHLTVVGRSEAEMKQLQQRCMAKGYPLLPQCAVSDLFFDEEEWPTLGYGSLHSAESARREHRLEGSHKHQYDVVGCFRGMDQAFRQEQTARRLLATAAAALRDGGTFVGIMTDSSNLFTRAHKRKWKSDLIEGEGFQLRMPPGGAAAAFASPHNAAPFQLRVQKQRKREAKFDGRELQRDLFLVHCPTLLRLCRELGLELVEIQGMGEFVEENKKRHQFLFDKLLGAGTKFSASHIHHLSLYCVFVFKKRKLLGTA